MQTACDAIVVGGGPAGCAAAGFLARNGWNVQIVDRSMAGSYLASLGHVNAFPGFPEAIAGQELLRRMRRQAELHGAKLVNDAVAAITPAEGGFTLATESGKSLGARAVVIATGASTRVNPLPGEREYLGRGVSYDVLSDGPQVAKKVAAVIGKNRHAVDEALELARFAEKIHFFVPAAKLEVDEPMLERLQKSKPIELHFSASLKKISGTEHVNAITVFLNGQEKEMHVNGVFLYVHEHKACTSFLERVVEMGASGAIKVDGQLSTSVSGIFACGDCLCGRPQLPAISSSQGLLAGIGADHHLTRP